MISPVQSGHISQPSTIAPSAPEPAGASFREVLASKGASIGRGADDAQSVLPGAPQMALAIRGPAGGATSVAAAAPRIGAQPTAFASAAEGPGGASAGGTIGAGSGDLNASLQQSQEMNLYYLQIQQQVDAQNRQFTTLSNVMKSEHDTVKTAIGNIHA